MNCLQCRCQECVGHHLRTPCTSKIVTLGYGYNLATVHRLVISKAVFWCTNQQHTTMDSSGNKEVIKRGQRLVALLLGQVVLTIRRVSTRTERSLFKVKEQKVSCYENDTYSVLSIRLFMVYLTTISVSEATGNKSMKSFVCLLIIFSIRHSNDIQQSQKCMHQAIRFGLKQPLLTWGPWMKEDVGKYSNLIFNDL